MFVDLGDVFLMEVHRSEVTWKQTMESRLRRLSLHHFGPVQGDFSMYVKRISEYMIWGIRFDTHFRDDRFAFLGGSSSFLYSHSPIFLLW
jgi:hypothetical protein